jgi:hypothetical protein
MVTRTAMMARTKVNTENHSPLHHCLDELMGVRGREGDKRSM